MQTNSNTSSAFHKLKCILISICMLSATIHSPAINAQGNDVDIVVPDVTLIENTTGVIGEPQTVVVSVKDDRAIQYVTLFFRFRDTGNFSSQPMTQTTNTRFEATVFPTNKNENIFQYYIKAADASDNTTFSGHTFSPKSRQLTPASAQASDTEQKEDLIVAQPANTGTVTAQPIESTQTSSKSTGNRTLYTVLGVLAAAVLIGAAASGGGSSSGGASNCLAEGCPVKFISTAP